MDAKRLRRAAELLRKRNGIDAELAQLIGRPPLPGHLGEWVAQEVLGVVLEKAANVTAIDGRFGPSAPPGLVDKTVNVKSYGLREGILDVTDDEQLDYFLVFTGPKATTVSSAGGTRPWRITNVYLFDAHALRDDRLARGIQGGTGSSVRSQLWQNAEIFPETYNGIYPLNDAQREGLRLFAPTL